MGGYGFHDRGHGFHGRGVWIHIPRPACVTVVKKNTGSYHFSDFRINASCGIIKYTSQRRKYVFNKQQK